jgi:hypothetical protein
MGSEDARSEGLSEKDVLDMVEGERGLAAGLMLISWRNVSGMSGLRPKFNQIHRVESARCHIEQL